MLVFVTALSFYLVQFQLVWVPLNWIPSVVTKAWGHREGWTAGYRGWVEESVSNLCVGAGGKVPQKSFIFCDMWPRTAVYFKTDLFVYVCTSQHLSRMPRAKWGVQHPWNTNHLLGMVGKHKNYFTNDFTTYYYFTTTILLIILLLPPFIWGITAVMFILTSSQRELVR